MSPPNRLIPDIVAWILYPVTLALGVFGLAHAAAIGWLFVGIGILGLTSSALRIWIRTREAKLVETDTLRLDERDRVVPVLSSDEQRTQYTRVAKLTMAWTLGVLIIVTGIAVVVAFVSSGTLQIGAAVFAVVLPAVSVGRMITMRRNLRRTLAQE